MTGGNFHKECTGASVSFRTRLPLLLVPDAALCFTQGAGRIVPSGNGVVIALCVRAFLSMSVLRCAAAQTVVEVDHPSIDRIF